MSRPPSQTQYPPPALPISPLPSQTGAVTGADGAYSGPARYDSPYPHPEGQQPQRLVDNRFLLGTLALGFAAWIICLVSQAIVTRDESNAPVNTLWFALFLQLYLLYCITLPSSRTPWFPTTNSLPEPVTSHTSQVPSSPPTLPPIVIDSPGNSLRPFSLRSGSIRALSLPVGDKEKGVGKEERPKSGMTSPTSGEGTTRASRLLSPPPDERRTSGAPSTAPLHLHKSTPPPTAPLQIQRSTSGPPPPPPPHETPPHPHLLEPPNTTDHNYVPPTTTPIDEVPTPPDHPPTLQLAILAAVCLIFAVRGIDENIYSPEAGQKALGAGWIAAAAVDILWIMYFSSGVHSRPRRVLDVANTSRYPEEVVGEKEVRDSKFTPPGPFPTTGNRLSKLPPASRTSDPRAQLRPAPPSSPIHGGHAIPKWKFRLSGTTVQSVTEFPSKLTRGLSRRLTRSSRPRPTSIPVVANKEEAFGHTPGSVELTSPRRSLGERPGAASPSSLGSGSAGRSLTHRVSPPPIPADLEAQLAQTQAQYTNITPPEERRLSVVPEIPSVGSPTPNADGARSLVEGMGEAKSMVGEGVGSEGSRVSTAPRVRVSNSHDPEKEKRRSAGVWSTPPELVGSAKGSDVRATSAVGGGNEKGGDEPLKLGDGARARAIYDYPGSQVDSNELSFKKGELLEIIDGTGKWWDARKEDGTVGIVPSNYIRLLSDS